jgi:hypothetical protein
MRSDARDQQPSAAPASTPADTQRVVTQAAKPIVTPPAVKPLVAKSPATKLPALPPNSFRLTVTSTPSATLYVDGRRIGATPISTTLSNRGRRFFRLEREGYKTKRDYVSAKQGTTVRRSYALERKPK